MPRSVQKLSTLVRTYFTVYDAANNPVTGLTDGDFDKLLAFNGSNSGLPITVSEIGNGRYMATFTPNLTGSYYMLIRNATYNPQGWDEIFDVTVDGVFTINEIFDKADGVETGYTLRDTMRVMSAVLCGVVTGGAGSPIFRNMPNTADRVTAVADGSGNRSSVILTP